MEIEIKCKIEPKHLEIIRKYAKLVEKTDDREVYRFLNVTAVIKDGVATISMKIKSEKEAPKAQKKLLAMASKFGLEVC